jgi:hypothetical protein
MPVSPITPRPGAAQASSPGGVLSASLARCVNRDQTLALVGAGSAFGRRRWPPAGGTGQPDRPGRCSPV